MEDKYSYLKIRYSIGDLIGKPAAIAIVLLSWAVIIILVKIRFLSRPSITNYVFSALFMPLAAFIAYMFLGKAISCKLKPEGILIKSLGRAPTYIFWDYVESYSIKDNKVFLKVKNNPDSLVRNANIKLPLTEHKDKIIRILNEHIKRKSAE